jgi:hypothetical protein
MEAGETGMKDKKSMKLVSHRGAGVRFCLGCLIILLAFAAGACSQQTGTPGIQITTPSTGIAAGDVTISVSITDFQIDDTGTIYDFSKGHVIFYMDTPVPTYYEHAAFSKSGTYAVVNGTSYTWKSVPPGEHTFAAQLVNKDNSPLPAPVLVKKTITVGPPNGKPHVEILIPSDQASLSPGFVSVMVSVDHFIVSQAGMGVVNRPGQGHLIYYIDEDPPTDQGVPATTDTSIVSSDLQYMWKAVVVGKHTFSVQVVNNDDTPLATPLTAQATVDIAAGG